MFKEVQLLLPPMTLMESISMV